MDYRRYPLHFRPLLPSLFPITADLLAPRQQLFQYILVAALIVLHISASV
jgi:hypothetical protein